MSGDGEQQTWWKMWAMSPFAVHDSNQASSAVEEQTERVKPGVFHVGDQDSQ